jgi:glycosyltransferase involved in cell wall biosynthesis
LTGTQSPPLVTIRITTFNQEKFSEEAVISAVEQDYQNLQVVVTDDHSQDGTPEILRRLAKSYPKTIDLILNEQNIGRTQNQDLALKASKGELLAFLDGDDVLLPGKITRQVEFMQQNPSLVISYHDVEVFDTDTGQILYYWSERFGSRGGDVETIVRYGNFIPSTGVMLRRTAIPTKGYDHRVSIGADWLLFIETLHESNGKFGYFDEVLSRYRRHSENVTSNWDAKLIDHLDIMEIVNNEYPDLRPYTKKRLSDVYVIEAAREFGIGAWSLAFRSFFKAVRSALPNIFLVIRLPLRELWFILKSRKLDPLMRSLFQK